MKIKTKIKYNVVTKCMEKHSSAHLVVGMTTVSVKGTKAAITLINDIIKSGGKLGRCVNNGREYVDISFFPTVKFADLEFEDHIIPGGIGARLGDYSVIQGEFAYCNEGTYEVGKITNGQWDVEGHCSEKRVEAILNGASIAGNGELE